MKVLRNIINWPMAMARCFAREWHTVLHDPGALIFFVILPLMYPIAYTLIYNPEVVRELPVAVVDHDRSFESRKLVRDASASPTIEIYDYVPDMPAARDLMARGDVMGILEIPSGYGRKIGRMEQANATFYCQMSLLLRYRAFVSAITNRDYTMIMATTIFLATLMVVANLICDLLYKLVDPRIKFD